VLVLGLLAAALAVTTLQSWRRGEEPRDVGLLGAIALMLGSGAVAAVVF
jgi:hypothetical protein